MLFIYINHGPWPTPVVWRLRGVVGVVVVVCVEEEEESFHAVVRKWQSVTMDESRKF